MPHPTPRVRTETAQSENEGLKDYLDRMSLLLEQTQHEHQQASKEASERKHVNVRRLVRKEDGTEIELAPSASPADQLSEGACSTPATGSAAAAANMNVDIAGSAADLHDSYDEGLEQGPTPLSPIFETATPSSSCLTSPTRTGDWHQCHSSASPAGRSSATAWADAQDRTPSPDRSLRGASLRSPLGTPALGPASLPGTVDTPGLLASPEAGAGQAGQGRPWAPGSDQLPHKRSSAAQALPALPGSPPKKRRGLHSALMSLPGESEELPSSPASNHAARRSKSRTPSAAATFMKKSPHTPQPAITEAAGNSASWRRLPSPAVDGPKSGAAKGRKMGSHAAVAASTPPSQRKTPGRRFLWVTPRKGSASSQPSPASTHASCFSAAPVEPSPSKTENRKLFSFFSFRGLLRRKSSSDKLVSSSNPSATHMRPAAGSTYEPRAVDEATAQTGAFASTPVQPSQPRMDQPADAAEDAALPPSQQHGLKDEDAEESAAQLVQGLLRSVQPGAATGTAAVSPALARDLTALTQQSAPVSALPFRLQEREAGAEAAAEAPAEQPDGSPSVGPSSAREHYYNSLADAAVGQGLLAGASTDSSPLELQLPPLSDSWDSSLDPPSGMDDSLALLATDPAAYSPPGPSSPPLQEAALYAAMPRALAHARLQQDVRALTAAVTAQVGAMQTPRGSRKPLVTVHVPMDSAGDRLLPTTLSINAASHNTCLSQPPQQRTLGSLSDCSRSTLPGAIDSSEVLTETFATAAHALQPATAGVDTETTLPAESQLQGAASLPVPSRKQAALSLLKQSSLRRSNLDRASSGWSSGFSTARGNPDISRWASNSTETFAAVQNNPVYDSLSEGDPASPRLDAEAISALTSGQQASPRQQAVERLKALHLRRTNSPAVTPRLSAPAAPQSPRPAEDAAVESSSQDIEDDGSRPAATFLRRTSRNLPMSPSKDWSLVSPRTKSRLEHQYMPVKKKGHSRRSSGQGGLCIPAYKPAVTQQPAKQGAAAGPVSAHPTESAPAHRIRQVQPWQTTNFAALASKVSVAEGARPDSHRAAVVPADAPAWPLDNLLGQVTDLLNAVSGILVTDHS